VKPSLRVIADHIIKMSIKLIEHAKRAISHELVSRAVRIELSSVDRRVKAEMKDSPPKGKRCITHLST
jgi:hypothetical protein